MCSFFSSRRNRSTGSARSWIREPPNPPGESLPLPSVLLPILLLHLFAVCPRILLPRTNDRLLLSSSHARMHASFFCCCPSSAPARLHDYALAFLGPGIVLLVGRVYQRVILLVFFHVLPHPARIKKRVSVCTRAALA